MTPMACHQRASGLLTQEAYVKMFMHDDCFCDSPGPAGLLSQDSQRAAILTMKNGTINLKRV